MAHSRDTKHTHVTHSSRVPAPVYLNAELRERGGVGPMGQTSCWGNNTVTVLFDEHLLCAGAWAMHTLHFT